MSQGPPLKPYRCRRPDCTLPHGGRCALINQYPNPLADCVELWRVESETAGEDVVAKADSVEDRTTTEAASLDPAVEADAAPWGGRHLDLLEADNLLRRSLARVICVLGPHGAGKTCLLASFFLQLATGQRHSFPYRFASSRTLYGFNDLIERANRWTGREGEEIVGHTPKERTERPGQFLHLGFRPADPHDQRHVDVLLSDVPGEWISDWTLHAEEEATARVNFIQRCDGVVVVVDAAVLMEPKGRTMDASIGSIIRRLIDELPARRTPRPLALVFSKFDLIVKQSPVPDAANRHNREAWGPLGRRAALTWSALEDAKEAGFEVAPFAVSAFPVPLYQGQPAGVMSPFTFLMHHADRRERLPPLLASVPDDARWFNLCRRWDRSP